MEQTLAIIVEMWVWFQWIIDWMSLKDSVAWVGDVVQRCRWLTQTFWMYLTDGYAFHLAIPFQELSRFCHSTCPRLHRWIFSVLWFFSSSKSTINLIFKVLRSPHLTSFNNTAFLRCSSLAVIFPVQHSYHLLSQSNFGRYTCGSGFHLKSMACSTFSSNYNCYYE